MKILVANKFFFINGGSERVFFQERESLLKHNFDVIDFSMDDSRNLSSPWGAYFISNIKYNNLNSTWKKFHQGFKFIHSHEAIHKLQALINQEKPEIAHLHNIYHQLTPSIIPLLKKRGCKTVMTLHDGKLICPSYLMLNKGMICTACNGKYFWRPVSKHCQESRLQETLLMIEAFWHKWKGNYDLIDIFISPSQFMAEMVSRRIPIEKIRVLQNGIDTSEYKPTFQDDGYCLYFGRLSMEKGIGTLVKAYETLCSGMPLYVAGTGPLLKEFADQYPNVNFLGYKQGEELKDIIRRSAFVVVPSEWNENCSMVVLEAMALGKPVIGSRIGGIPEQVLDGETGLLFEMGNAKQLSEKMSILFQDKELRARMGKAAIRRVEKEYSLENHCSRLMDIYNELLRKT